MAAFLPNEVLSRITYKPGTRLEVTHDAPRNRYLLHISMPVPDVNSSHTMEEEDTWLFPDGYDQRFLAPRSRMIFDLTPVVATKEIPLITMEKEEQFINFVRYCLRDLEDHEFCEWFKVDGISYTDPHPELRKNGRD